MKKSPFKDPLSKEELDAEYKKDRKLRLITTLVSYPAALGLLVYTYSNTKDGIDELVIRQLFIFPIILLMIFFLRKIFFPAKNSKYAECTPDEIDSFNSYAKNNQVKDLIVKINKHKRKPVHYELIEVQEYLDSIDDNQAYNDFKKLGE